MKVAAEAIVSEPLETQAGLGDLGQSVPPPVQVAPWRGLGETRGIDRNLEAMPKEAEGSDLGSEAFHPPHLHKSLVVSDFSHRDSFHVPEHALQAGVRGKPLKRIQSSGNFLGFQSTGLNNDPRLRRCCPPCRKPLVPSPNALDSVQLHPQPIVSSQTRPSTAGKNLTDPEPQAVGGSNRETLDTNCTGESEQLPKSYIARSQFRSKSVSTASNPCTPRQIYGSRILMESDLRAGCLGADIRLADRRVDTSFELDQVLSEDDNKINFGNSLKISQSVPDDGFLEEDQRHVETIVFRKREEAEQGEMSGPMMVVASGFTAIAVTGFFIVKGLRSVFG